MRAISLGLLARDALLQGLPASVIGVTSGGVFVLTQDQQVLFLTYSPYHGPSTINLEASLVDLRQNEMGGAVRLNPSQIEITGSGLKINVNGAALWNPAAPQKPDDQQINTLPERLERVALAAGSQKGAEGLAPGLKWLVGKGPVVFEGDLTEKIVAGLADLRSGIANNDLKAIIQAAGRISGYGRGLTPAADDCIAGILLCLNRWKNVIRVNLNLADLNEALILVARQKTTSLSATIIEAAALGMADERILRVLDGIVNGDFDEPIAVRDLVKMGHTSGVDSLVGITIAFSAK
ncbi:MAG TPA: DUF2877 domain-containing protein [Anaerolineaceae bacterium]|nr:DUF2877 domain-containing protein [Anaerolineaceae bacterium]